MKYVLFKRKILTKKQFLSYINPTCWIGEYDDIVDAFSNIPKNIRNKGLSFDNTAYLDVTVGINDGKHVTYVIREISEDDEDNVIYWKNSCSV